ncbi:MAG: MCE family protein [Chitinophagaceae bacterium]|nr:MCE family protein [Oligoflexus sp.]
MSRMGTEFKVGLFTLLGVGAIAFAVFFVSPELFDRKEKKVYKTALKDASGILINTHVKTNGVNIGRVSVIKLVENTTEVELEVEAQILIPEGSEIAVRTVGFLGDKFIDVVRPEKGGAPLANNAFIPPAKNTGDIAEVMGKVGSIADDMKKVTENLAKVLGDKRGEQRMEKIAENIEKLTEAAKNILQENRSDVRALVANFKEVSTSLKEVMNDDNKAKIDRILANLDTSMDQIKGASENAKLITQRIEKGEGTIGRLINDDKTADDIQATLKDLREVLSPVTKLQVAVETHVEARQDETNQTYFNIRLNTRPDSFYLIGFTSFPDRVRDTATETLPGSAGKTAIRETIRDNKALRFNLQFGKRWGWIGARLGLFESTGGAASDLYFWKDKFKLSLEVFDFSDKTDTTRRTAHLKAYASVLFFDHLVAMAGLDDPTKYAENTTKVRKKLNPFVGAGLTFNDQDLKTLFGAAAIGATGAGSGL